MRAARVALMAAAATEVARTQRTEKLWPEGAPDTVEAGGYQPELIFSLIEADAPTPAVVIFPGGGYMHLAINHEGQAIRKWLATLGIQSAVCTYRNKGTGYRHPAPLQDAQRAVQTLRARAKELNVDPKKIGVIGFSAGGHLAATVSNFNLAGDPAAADAVARVSSRPDFSILCYSVIAFGNKEYTHKGSQHALLGKRPAPELVASLSAENAVTSETPPTFLMHTEADQLVPAENSRVYFQALQRRGVSSELHVFEEGKHGVGLAKNVPVTSEWPSRCEAWLRSIGVLAAPS